MNKRVIITADSVCDLSPELRERYGIQVLPLTVLEGERAYKDGVDLTPDLIYRIYREEGLLPKTTAISPQEFIDYFTPILAEGCEVVHLDISSKLSGTYQNACIAAQELPGFYPVDTMHLSNSMALMLFEACRLRDEGRSAHEIVDYILAYREKVHTSFVLDTLEFMWKGGRCSGVTALGANLLQIKPCIEMVDGELKVGRKYRGAIDKVYAQYIRDKLATANIDTRVATLTHSGGVKTETIDSLRKLILDLVPFETLHVMQTGCTVSSHCGPGTLGVLFATR